MKILGYILIFWATYDIVSALYKVKKGSDFYGNNFLEDFKKELLRFGKAILGDILVLIYTIYHLIN